MRPPSLDRGRDVRSRVRGVGIPLQVTPAPPPYLSASDGMNDEPKNKSVPPIGGSSKRNTAWAWGFIDGQFVLLLVGAFFFKEAFYGAWGAGGDRFVLLWVAIGAWSLAVFLGACALQVVYGFDVVGESKSAIASMAVLGIVLNALPLILFGLLYLGLQGIGR
jgi:hypothetical protein